MAVRKRGSVWWYDFMIQGIRYRARVPAAQSRHEALDAESVARREVFEGTYGKPKGSDVFIDYVDKVFLPWSKQNKRSWSDDVYHAETFRKFFGQKRFSDITPFLIEKFKSERRSTRTKLNQPRSPASVNREVELLSRVFSLAIRDGVAASNPCSQVQKYREDNQRTRYLGPEEEEALLAQLVGPRAHLRPVVILAIHTGMRRGEILSRAWAHVDFGRNVIHVTNTKSGRNRVVPMNEVVRSELLQLKGAGNPCGPIFVSMKTGAALVEIKKGFRAACDSALIEDMHFHDLRHTFGTRLGANGKDPFTIAELMGHADLRMTRRYTHATSRNLRDAVDSLAETNCHRIVTMDKKKATG
ncbi:MAG TPA: site-specific integrase [Blastocatellia bacterium]